MTERRIGRTTRYAAATFGALVLDRLFALAFTVLMSSAYGATRQLDAYLLAVVGPTLIGTLVADLAYSMLLPELMQSFGGPSGFRDSWNFLLWTAIALFVVTAAYAAVWAAGVAVTGAGAGSLLMTIGLVVSPMIALVGISTVGATVLVAAERYVAASIRVPAASFVTVIVFIALNRAGIGVIALALSTVAGWLVSAAAMVALVSLVCRAPRFTMSIQGAARLGRQLARASLAQLTAGISTLAPTPIERLIAFPLGAGVLSSLNYGRVLVSPPLLIAQSIASASYPHYVELHMKQAEGRIEALSRSLGIAIFLILPLSVLFAALAHPLVLIVYHRGAFDERSVERTAVAAVVLAAGILPTAMSFVLIRFLYAERAFDRVARVWVAVVIAYAAMAFGLAQAGGYVGLAWASTASNILLVILLVAALRPELRPLSAIPWHSSAKSLAAGALLTATVIVVQAVVHEPPSLTGELALAAGASATGALMYVLAAWLLRSQELSLTVTAGGRLFRTLLSRRADRAAG